jgi:mannose-6-phosphate isomerase
LPGEGEPAQGLAYLFAAAGSARVAGPGFEPVDLPARGIVAVPAVSLDFAIEDLGGLELIRIAPNWPEKKQ